MTALLATLIIAGLALIGSAGWRLIRGPRRVTALTCLLLGVAPLGLMAGHILYGLKIGQGGQLVLHELTGPNGTTGTTGPHSPGAVMVDYLLARWPERFLTLYATCRPGTFARDCEASWESVSTISIPPTRPISSKRWLVNDPGRSGNSSSSGSGQHRPSGMEGIPRRLLRCHRCLARTLPAGDDDDQVLLLNTDASGKVTNSKTRFAMPALRRLDLG